MGARPSRFYDNSIYGGLLARKMQPSDIHEHLDTLTKLASQSMHVTEAGVRGAVSSYALAHGLINRSGTKLVQIDLEDSDAAQAFRKQALSEGLDVVFYNESDLTCPVARTDMLFIDTWHVYAQLKRELERWAHAVNKFIVLHDTTVDGELGESVRLKSDMHAQARASGFTVQDIARGLWPAVVEFLQAHPEWRLQKRFTNNNGLTILVRQ